MYKGILHLSDSDFVEVAIKVLSEDNLGFSETTLKRELALMTLESLLPFIHKA